MVEQSLDAIASQWAMIRKAVTGSLRNFHLGWTSSWTLLFELKKNNPMVLDAGIGC